ncbi:MAG: universal stress protein [Sediminicola sp.]|tara:strand:- start:124058 stop:124879 length:822 start_codon:yes stop_codon:yes gene_type:complete
MKKIIVPVDFSEQSEFALKAAASMARRYGSEILAVHMLELSSAIITTSEGLQQDQMLFLLKFTEKRFNEFLQKPYLQDVKVTPLIKHFKVFSELNEIAEKHQADLVVMGSHGTDGLQEIFIGSNAEKVVRNSTIPVLVIKDQLPDFEIRNFVFACDFKEENLSAIEKAKEFAEKLSADLQLVYINTPGDNFLSTTDAYTRISKFLNLAKLGKEVEIYNDYTVEMGIINFSKTRNADIIGIPTHGRKGLTHFFMGSIGEDVANHSKIPVLTFKI